MKSFSYQIAVSLERHPMQRSLRARCRVGALIVAIMGLSAGSVSIAQAQPGGGLFASDGKPDAREPAANRGHRDWRNTLGGQDHASESAVQRRKMSEEERSSLREHLRNAARGAYPEQAPKRKGKR